LGDEGLELIEVADGIDVKRQVLGEMEFEPIVRQVRPMPASAFAEPFAAAAAAGALA
jgi:propionate CoA-transferase